MQEINQQDFNLFTKLVTHRKLKFISAACAIFLLTLLLLDCSFVRYRLLDQTLAPAFWSGQKVVTLRWAYLFHLPKRDDLIIYSPYSGFYVPGKVLALPGDRLSMEGSTLTLNSTPLNGVQLPIGYPEENLIVPPKYICVTEPTPLATTARCKLVALDKVCGRILGHWQILLI